MTTDQPRPTPKSAPKAAIAPPKGTRDLYPEDALRRRYVQQAWRDASIRCGFDEIAGPTFETSDLYAVKSGEGILSELFQAYSGKAEEEIEQVKATGRAPYALRPEFTPTLARMYAAKAGSLPKPCKWFTAGSYFRAERPQRGRLREFEQWNVDLIGDDSDAADLELIECCTTLLRDLGVGFTMARVSVSNRQTVADLLLACGVHRSRLDEAFRALDALPKVGFEEFSRRAVACNLDAQRFDEHLRLTEEFIKDELLKRDSPVDTCTTNISVRGQFEVDLVPLMNFLARAQSSRAWEWLDFNFSIVRGLAYYTGTVFEVIAEGERAVAGGGRYDNLIELMGGPPTPAVGFAMGDVVLSLLLDDKGLMPAGADLMDAVSRPPASVRPEVFVLGADDDATDPLVRRLTADLRRGVESARWAESDAKKPWSRERYDPTTGGVRPLHARLSYKSTRNLKKLLADAEKQHARLAAIVHGQDRVELKDLDARRSLTPADIPGMPASAAEFSVNPASDLYLARAAAALLGT